ncbi:hypothetical protein BU25DRAFT_450656 [Macroventuria anomochaeta]|uniref:Uncharacterized protein n=1 Tax=Macroventuria anomochaeta TaxID=301207 RepID=A0ACB6RS28_9PLEO|nr:uncharacterized protein BU25DRAFT_450656 [Macroventuria anomochaeta]KAF2624603.1 hypothetical protein BU25DRAFT_450656 [Macroventuria anomochaeta]
MWIQETRGCLVGDILGAFERSDVTASPGQQQLDLHQRQNPPEARRKGLPGASSWAKWTIRATADHYTNFQHRGATLIKPLGKELSDDNARWKNKATSVHDAGHTCAGRLDPVSSDHHSERSERRPPASRECTCMGQGREVQVRFRKDKRWKDKQERKKTEDTETRDISFVPQTVGCKLVLNAHTYLLQGILPEAASIPITLILARKSERQQRLPVSTELANIPTRSDTANEGQGKSQKHVQTVCLQPENSAICCSIIDVSVLRGGKDARVRFD